MLQRSTNAIKGNCQAPEKRIVRFRSLCLTGAVREVWEAPGDYHAHQAGCNAHRRLSFTGSLKVVAF